MVGSDGRGSISHTEDFQRVGMRAFPWITEAPFAVILSDHDQRAADSRPARQGC